MTERSVSPSMWSGLSLGWVGVEEEVGEEGRGWSRGRKKSSISMVV